MEPPAGARPCPNCGDTSFVTGTPCRRCGYGKPNTSVVPMIVGILLVTCCAFPIAVFGSCVLSTYPSGGLFARRPATLATRVETMGTGLAAMAVAGLVIWGTVRLAKRSNRR